MTIENVKITNVSLTMADHGCLTFYITVEGAGIGVNLGGYCIGTGYLGAKEFSAESGGGLVAMMNIMNVVGVHKWEDLKGKYCRIKIDDLRSTVSIIGSVTENQWFDMKKFFEEYDDKDIYDRDKEALEFAVKAVEKQIPKKLKHKTKRFVIKGFELNDDYTYCPLCNKLMGNLSADSDFNRISDYCPDCGQALDWGGEDE